MDASLGVQRGGAPLPGGVGGALNTLTTFLGGREGSTTRYDRNCVVPANQSIGVGLLGYGNIGSEVFRYLREAGGETRVVRVARRRACARAP